MRLTIGAAQQIRFADRVISLTDTGDIRKRDSLLMAAGRMNVPTQENESGDDENTLVTARPLSTLEVVQGIVVGAMPQDSSSSDHDHATATNSAAYRYYVGFAGRRKFLIFLGLCAIFVFGMTFNRESP